MIEPCDKDGWTCECKQCNEYWDWMAEQETKSINTSSEYDEELDQAQAEHYGIDGW